MAYFEFPHTRTYDSDLGWIIKRITEQQIQMDGQAVKMDELQAWMDENEPKIDEIEELYKAFSEGELPQPIVDALNEWLTQYGVLASANAYTDAAASDLSDRIDIEVLNRTDADALLQSQIDDLVTPPGQVPSVAEVTNARIGYDNVTYSTLGDAIRAQTGRLADYTSELAESENLTAAADVLNEIVTGNDPTGAANNLIRHSAAIAIPTWAKGVKIGNQVESGGTMYNIAPAAICLDKDGNYRRSILAASGQPYVTAQIEGADKFILFNQPNINRTGTSGFWFTPTAREEMEDINGLVGRFSGSFASANQQLGTGIYLDTNTNYIIKINTVMGNTGSAHINAFLNSNSFAYCRGRGVYAFNSGSYSGNLKIYNGTWYTGAIDLEVYKADSFGYNNEYMDVVYDVGPNRSYTSLTALLLYLKNDSRKKTIIIENGNYDIFQEYVNAGLITSTDPANPTTGYWNYNAWIPKNTRLVGSGIVKLYWMPTTAQITPAYSQACSPLNVAGNCEIENIEIHCKNGRYCIHGDNLDYDIYNQCRMIFKNVYCYKYANDSGYGFKPVIGFGISRENYYEFNNCRFIGENDANAFYMHNRATYNGTNSILLAQSPEIVCNNCIMDTPSGYAVRFGNVNGSSAQRIRSTFNGCYFSTNGVRVSDEGSSSGNYPNTFDVTILNSYNPIVNILSSVNPYPAKIYPTPTP